MEKLLMSSLNGIYRGINGSTHYIILFENGESKQCIDVGRVSHYGRNSSFYVGWGEYTEATEQEKLWLKECIRLNKRAEVPEINYSIISEPEIFN